MCEWQPIETAPLDGTPLLLFCPGMNSWNRLEAMPDIVVGAWTYSHSEAQAWYSDYGDVDYYESAGAYFMHVGLHPTHWMPLPQPPEGGGFQSRR